MMKKRITAILLCMLLSLGVLSGCGGNGKSQAEAGNEPSAETTGGTIDVTFWSAPKQTQCDHWTALAEEFNGLGVTYQGKTVHVTVEMIPETDSSESAIQNALATDSAPAASENINNSFMAILADADAVYPLTGEDWFDEVLARKQISDTVMNTWLYNGEQYVLPEYINPLCLQWNVKALKALGYDKAPETWDEYLAVIRAYADHRDEMKAIGCDFSFTRPTFLNASKYYHRNYDILMIYQSLGGGALYDGNKMNIDPAVMGRVFEFYGLLGDTMCLDSLSDVWVGEAPLVLFDIGCPWNVSSYAAAGLVYGEDYVFAPNIVMNRGDTAHGYADTKGIVFYKDSNISDEMHGAMVEFIKWVYNDENCDESDLAFFQASAQMPVRGDLLSNDTFSEAMSGAEWQLLAGMITDAEQGPTHAESTAMYEVMCQEGLAPYFTETVKHPAMTEIDPTDYVANMIQKMAEAGGLES